MAKCNIRFYIRACRRVFLGVCSARAFGLDFCGDLVCIEGMRRSRRGLASVLSDGRVRLSEIASCRGV